MKKTLSEKQFKALVTQLVKEALENKKKQKKEKKSPVVSEKLTASELQEKIKKIFFEVLKEEMQKTKTEK